MGDPSESKSSNQPNTLSTIEYLFELKRGAISSIQHYYRTSGLLASSSGTPQ
jgi:hypothetical protein